ncbi:MAG: MmcQ/YjbR family DNA-binding protein [Xanthobacteraceae bacterium]
MAAQFRQMALALDGTIEAPHFDRTAFRVRRIYATLAPDARTANLKFSLDEQALKCAVASEAFAPVANAWGRQGWTVATLAKLTAAEARDALQIAWRHALANAGRAGKKR